MNEFVMLSDYIAALSMCLAIATTVHTYVIMGKPYLLCGSVVLAWVLYFHTERMLAHLPVG